MNNFMFQMQLKRMRALSGIELDDNSILENIASSSDFKNWFGDSVMTDKSGKPIVFYHGSNSEFDTFDKSKMGTSTDPGWLGVGFYFYTDYHEASQYGKVKVYHLRIENPYYATDEENSRLADANNLEASQEFTNEVRGEGYDGVYYNGNLRGETVVFEPEQIWRIQSTDK